jgi:hypothetical protein
MTDDLMLLADSLGFQDLVTAEKLRRSARDADVGAAAITGEPPVTPPSVAADSEGRAGHRPVPGAVPLTLPKPPKWKPFLRL